MSFPVEAVPGGTVLAPHHYSYLMLAALLVALTVWDDHRDREPVVVVASLVAGLVGFMLVWPTQPEVGATLALLAPVPVAVDVLRPGGPWRRPTSPYPFKTGALVVLLAVLALDDAVEHALGLPTPLDTAWAVLGPAPSAVLAVVVLGGLAYLSTRP